MNRVLATSGIKVELVKTTGPSIAKSLFSNNSNGADFTEDCGNCIICRNGAHNVQNTITSTVTGKSYRIPKNLTCANGNWHNSLKVIPLKAWMQNQINK